MTTSYNPFDAIPTNLESGIVQLENANRVHVFDSGNSAFDAILQLLPRDSRILVPESWRLGTWTRHPWGRTIVPVGYDATSLRDVRFLLERGAAAILVESPSDPLLEISDLDAIAKAARGAGALLVVDNSALTGFVQKPLDHGADLVLYTSLQALAGHIPAKAGAIATRDEGLAGRLGEIRAREGSALSSGDAWLLLQGFRTFRVRAEAAQTSALRIAQWLSNHPRVAKVLHPHAPNHPGSGIHLRQSEGPGWIVGFETTAPWLAPALLRSLRVWERSTLRGCGESTATHPYTGSHGELPESTLRRLRIGESLVRLTVGVEDVEELIADLDQALRTPQTRGTQEPDWII